MVLQSRSVWFDVVGRHCPAFAVNREVRLFFWEQIEGSLSGSSCRKVGDLIEVFVQVLMPIPKPTGFTGADPYKM